jgi:hypothetical protein
MAGPKENLAEGWALLRQGIDKEDPATPTLYLGCEQSTHDLTLPSGAKVRSMVYDMEKFLGTCVDRYLQCTGAKEIKESSLPYLLKEEPQSIFNTATKNGLLPEMRVLPPDYNEWLKANGLDPVLVVLDEEYDDQWLIDHFAKYSVEPSSLTKGGTKVQQESISTKLMAKDGTDLSAVGELAPSAASVLMKIMYAARMARSD